MSNQLRIYVADLSAYNAGYLHGVWLDVCQDIELIYENIDKMFKESPVQGAEEYAIHDYEGFEGYYLDPYASIEWAHEIACFIAEYPDFGAELLSYYSNVDDARECAEERYIGCYESIADYAQEITLETTEIAEHIKYYIDYEAMGRDMILGGDVIAIEKSYQEFYLFWNN